MKPANLADFGPSVERKRAAKIVYSRYSIGAFQLTTFTMMLHLYGETTAKQLFREAFIATIGSHCETDKALNERIDIEFKKFVDRASQIIENTELDKEFL